MTPNPNLWMDCFFQGAEYSNIPDHTAELTSNPANINRIGIAFFLMASSSEFSYTK